MATISAEGQRLPRDVVHIDVGTRYAMTAGTVRVNGAPVPAVRSG